MYFKFRKKPLAQNRSVANFIPLERWRQALYTVFVNICCEIDVYYLSTGASKALTWFQYLSKVRLKAPRPPPSGRVSADREAFRCIQFGMLDFYAVGAQRLM